MITLPLESQNVPLELYEGKVYRIRGTRVSLESVVGAFQAGMSAEGIADAFPSLALSDVYQVIAYFLRRHNEVEAYMVEQKAGAETLASRATTTPAYQNWRKQLLMRAGRIAKAG